MMRRLVLPVSLCLCLFPRCSWSSCTPCTPSEPHLTTHLLESYDKDTIEKYILNRKARVQISGSGASNAFEVSGKELACSVERLKTAAESFADTFSSAGGWPDEVEKTMSQFQDKSETKIIFVVESNGGMLFVNLLQELFCSIQRLGLLRQVVVVALNPAAESIAKQFGITTIFSVALNKLIVSVGRAVNVNYPSRIAKLVAAFLFLEHGFNVLISDTDTIWVESPVNYLESFDADIVGTHDYCWMDMNSGLLFYRHSNSTINLLKTAMGYKKNPRHCTDNDQYLFNCAWPYHAAHHGLKVKFTDDRIQFSLQQTCAEEGSIPTMATSKPLYLWHTSGMTSVAFGGDSKGFESGALHILVGSLNRKDSGECLPPRNEEQIIELSYKARYRCTATWSGRICLEPHRGPPKCKPRVEHLWQLSAHLPQSTLSTEQWISATGLPRPGPEAHSLFSLKLNEFHCLVRKSHELNSKDPVQKAYSFMASSEARASLGSCDGEPVQAMAADVKGKRVYRVGLNTSFETPRHRLRYSRAEPVVEAVDGPLAGEAWALASPEALKSFSDKSPSLVSTAIWFLLSLSSAALFMRTGFARRFGRWVRGSG